MCSNDMCSHTKLEFCGLDSFGVTRKFLELQGNVKFLMLSFGETDGRTDRQTLVKQYAPDLSMREHQKSIGVNSPIEVNETKQERAPRTGMTQIAVTTTWLWSAYVCYGLVTDI